MQHASEALHAGHNNHTPLGGLSMVSLSEFAVIRVEMKQIRQEIESIKRELEALKKG
jgi:hypothetical protein